MTSHKNARLAFEGRELLIERIAVMGVIPAAEAAGISVRTVRNWHQRFEQHASQGLIAPKGTLREPLPGEFDPL